MPAEGLDAASGDGEAAWRCGFSPPCPLQHRFLQATLVLDHHLLLREQRTKLTAVLAAPSPPPGVCLLQPGQLNSSCNCSQSSLEALSWALTAACYWSWWLHEDELGKGHVELEDLEGILSLERWQQGPGQYPLWPPQPRLGQRKKVPLNSLLPLPAPAQTIPQAEEVSLFPDPQRTNSRAKNAILFIYFGFNTWRPLTTRPFTALLWFVWRHILLSQV